MDLSEAFKVDAPISAVLPLLRDVSAVAECLPGADLRDRDGDTYQGTITVKFGPTKVTFAGQAEITYPPDGDSVSIVAMGRDSRGASRASAEVLVTAREAAMETAIEIGGNVEVLGPLAQFARTGGVFVTRQLLKEFAVRIGERATESSVGSPTAADADGAADGVDGATTVAVRKPTQTVNGFSLFWGAFTTMVRERFSGLLRRRGEGR